MSFNEIRKAKRKRKLMVFQEVELTPKPPPIIKIQLTVLLRISGTCYVDRRWFRVIIITRLNTQWFVVTLVCVSPH